jgi:hypothetical protein
MDYLTELWSMDWIGLFQDKKRWRALVKAAMDLRGASDEENLTLRIY